ncbi:MAG: hypothetical protein ACP5GJ_03440 [Nanopusillaceae archaeon]|jgi:hypothetical protein
MGRVSKEEVEQHVDNLLKEVDQKGVLHLSIPEVVRHEQVSRTVAQVIYYKLLDRVIGNSDKYIINKVGSLYIIMRRDVQLNLNKNFYQGIIFSLSLLGKINKSTTVQLINNMKELGLPIDLKDLISDNELLLQILQNQYEQRQPTQ